MKPIRLILCSACCLVLLSLLTPLAPAAEPSASVLRVGVTPTTPPMIYREGGKLAGMEADFARVLGQSLGRPIEFVVVNWDEQIPALIEGKTDIIMSAMSITKPRQFRIAFSKSYLQVGQMALVRNQDAHRYALGFPYRPEGVIGVKKGTTGDFLVQQEFPQTKRKEFTSAEEGAKALVKKRVDLFIGDSPMIWWLSGVNEANGLTAVPILLSEESLAWGVRKGDGDLLTAVNRALEQMIQNGKLSEIVKRWIPQAR